MKKLFEPFFVIIFILAVTMANVWHIFYHWIHRQPGMVFIGISHHYEDYFYYLSQLTQGARGAWGIKNLYTTEPIPATPLWWTNILLGKISALTGLPPWSMYTIALCSVTIASLGLTWWAAKKLYPDKVHKRLAVFLMATLATCGYTYASGQVNQIVYFYNYTSSLNRLGGVVHLQIQNILSLLMIFLYADILKSYKANKILLLSLVTFLLAFINPVYIMINGVSMAMVTLAVIRPKRIIRLVSIACIIGLPLIIPALLMKQTFDIPFYQYFRWWESSVLRAPADKFFLSYGILGILAIIGLIPYIAKTNLLRTLGLIWAILPVAVYWSPLPGILSVPVFRLTQPPSYIILASLAVEGIWYIGNIHIARGGIKNFYGFTLRKKKKSMEIETAVEDVENFVSRPQSRKYNIIIFWILVSGFLISQLPMIREEIRSRTDNITLVSWLNYMDPDIITGLTYLGTLPHNKTAVAFNNLELVVPAISGARVYAAHRSLTVDYPRKIAEVSAFYSANIAPPDAQNWLTANNIGYVLWKKDNGDWSEVAAQYPFLTKIYENHALIIYSVSSSLPSNR